MVPAWHRIPARSASARAKESAERKKAVSFVVESGRSADAGNAARAQTHNANRKRHVAKRVMIVPFRKR